MFYSKKQHGLSEKQGQNINAAKNVFNDAVKKNIQESVNYYIAEKYKDLINKQKEKNENVKKYTEILSDILSEYLIFRENKIQLEEQLKEDIERENLENILKQNKIEYNINLSDGILAHKRESLYKLYDAWQLSEPRKSIQYCIEEDVNHLMTSTKMKKWIRLYNNLRM